MGHCPYRKLVSLQVGICDDISILQFAWAIGGDLRYSNNLESVARNIVDEVRALNLDVLNSGDERDEAGQKREYPKGYHGCDFVLPWITSGGELIVYCND
jgi:hypothetical protein